MMFFRPWMLRRECGGQGFSEVVNERRVGGEVTKVVWRRVIFVLRGIPRLIKHFHIFITSYFENFH